MRSDIICSSGFVLSFFSRSTMSPTLISSFIVGAFLFNQFPKQGTILLKKIFVPSGF